ncbi:MAG: C10 family peptidase [Muribaculaceae bacterium]|nr:C10 family peptidase [Muribaculaceae bacterium]
MKTRKILLSLISYVLLISCSNESVDLMYEATKQDFADNPYLITLNQAQEELNGIIGQLRNSSSRATDTMERKVSYSYSLKIPYENTKLQKSDSLLTYVINFEDNKGFAVMSGDNRIPSLIAYVTEGNLAPIDTIKEPSLASFLTALPPYIGDIISTEKFKWSIDFSTPSIIGSGYYEYGEWDNKKYPDSPLCPVQWGQLNPYNKFCPTIDGKKAPTGCVATAVAQLMAVYKYPSSYNGESFHWDKMTKFPKGSQCSELAQFDIARLMYQLGLPTNLNMNYGIEESGARIESIPRTLNSFGYRSSGIIKKYNTENVIDEILSYYPVIVSGYCKKKEIKFLGWTIYTNLSEGHAWLIHGMLKRFREIKWFSDDGYFISSRIENQWYTLCNWGWGGLSDGYFLSGVFDTAAALSDYLINSENDEDETRSGTSSYYQYNLKTISGIRK